jgi:hypothetical protein
VRRRGADRQTGRQQLTSLYISFWTNFCLVNSFCPAGQSGMVYVKASRFGEAHWSYNGVVWRVSATPGLLTFPDDVPPPTQGTPGQPTNALTLTAEDRVPPGVGHYTYHHQHTTTGLTLLLLLPQLQASSQVLSCEPRDNGNQGTPMIVGMSGKFTPAPFLGAVFTRAP